MSDLPHGHLGVDVSRPLSASDPYFDLGSQSTTLSTSTCCIDAKIWFNRGLVWCFAFNHLEALFCFHQAVQHDRAFALGQWGIAYASSPHYNKTWDLYDDHDLEKTIETMRDSSSKALQLAESSQVNAVELALIKAIPSRILPVADVSDQQRFQCCSDAYADAMRAVYTAHSDNLDVIALHIDAAMNTSPWALYNLYTGQPEPNSRAEEIRVTFEKAFALPGADHHAGLNHLYIHYVEMSGSPERGIGAADRLRNSVPDAGASNTVSRYKGDLDRSSCTHVFTY